MDAQLVEPVQPDVQTPTPQRLSSARAVGDRAWGVGLTALGATILVVAGVIIFSVLLVAQAPLQKVGIWKFVTGSDWDPVQESFGALPFIYGTLVTSVIAIAAALPIGLGVAVFISELTPARYRRALAFPVELLAAIPSVVYGLWGLFVLVPWLRDSLEPLLGRTLGWLPLFQGPPMGLGYLTAGLILAIMILPTITSVTIEVLGGVPPTLREAAFALGATRWEMVRIGILPVSRPGIIGAAILGFGRALGETMAVAMVIGNAPEIHASLFAPGYSLPAVIANEFAEATSHMHTAALAALALILLVITLILNGLARALVHALPGRLKGAHS